MPEPVPSLELTYGEEERVERRGADILVVKTKHIRNPMIQEQKKKTGRHREMEKGEGNSIGHKWIVCPGIEDRRQIDNSNTFIGPYVYFGGD